MSCLQREWAKIAFSLLLKELVLYFFHRRNRMKMVLSQEPSGLTQPFSLGRTPLKMIPGILPFSHLWLIPSPSSQAAKTGTDLIKQKRN